MAEELPSTAPTRVIDKQDQNVEQHRDALVSDSAAQLAEVEHVPGAERRLLRALQRDHEEGNSGRGHWDH
ncbi:hypothetical protein [Streptomyces sp. NPDC087859]|uniref:hypothetical protein n=1 Tax=Streptomyces sp. NPDC087859 TaxID=3365812 RepID=UPI003824146D